MNCQILSQIPVKQEWLDELVEYVDWDVTVTETNFFIKPKWNIYFNEMWGDFDWVKKNVPKGDIQCYVTSKEGLRNAEITSHLGMYDMVDKDGKHDFYIGVPRSLSKARSNGFKYPFTYLMLHEWSHGVCQMRGIHDVTHAMCDDGRLKDLIEEHNEYRKKQKEVVSLLERLKNLLKKKSLIHPVPGYKVSQPYGKKNKRWYQKTEHHIGTDYACPIGTPVRAPQDGKIISAGFSNTAGYYCHLEYTEDNQRYVARFLHLTEYPFIGSVKRGEEIATTGNTGKSTGPHLHVDVWLDMVRLDLINKDNWELLTVDPEKHYPV